MYHAKKMTDKIIKEVESDPKCGPILLRMDEADKRGIYALLETAGRLMCGTAEENITENVTQNLIKIIKEWCVTKEHLDEREEHYMEVLERSNQKQAEKLESVLIDVTKRISDRLSDVERKHGRRITDIEDWKKIAEAEISELKSQLTLVITELRLLSGVPRQLSSLHDTVNIVLSEVKSKSESAPAAPTKQSFFSKLPAPVWLAIIGVFTAIAGGTASAWVYLKTGKIILFGG